MSVRDTSLRVYHDEVAPNLGKKQLDVLNVLRSSKRPVCNQEIAIQMNRPINQITPRMNELVKLGKVELAFKYNYPATNRKVCYWRTSEKGIIGV